MPTSPPTITALPDTPDPDDTAGFDADAYAWTGALPTFRTEISAVASNVYANAGEAATGASTATTQAGIATAKAVLTAADAVATAADRVQTGLDAATATTKAGEASASALAAASSEAAAQAAVAGLGFSDVVFINAAMSPYAVTQATSGKLIACDTSGGAIVVNLPAIAGLATPYVVGVKKTTSDASAVTINRAGTDTFDDAGTSKALTTPAGVTLIPDVDTTPDVWVAIGFGGTNAGAVGGSGLTMSTGKILGRTTPGSGAIEELPLSAISPATVRTPVNASPAAAATDVAETPTLNAGAFYSLYGLAMTHSQWQVSTVSDFASTVVSSGDVAGTATTYAVPAGVLSVSTVYYWRARYKDADGVYSAWSDATGFTTKASFNDYIATPTATPALGAALEGGFYAGLIWNELVQSTTSVAIGTGTKAFTVADMSGAGAIVYAGQALEVRSRADPTKKMVGTVTGASGTTLTLNITSVGGAGTFTDWSVMAQYRLIVSPKASGENASIAYKNANSAAPSASITLTEGRKATLAMVAADTSTVYPAAHWCNNLNIGSRTDWYLPARDELELAWRNLKPTTDSNYTTADRATGASASYATLGSYGDTANTHGLNNNSSPAGSAYIAGTPAQTATTAFRTGNAEAFAYGSAVYWSASEYSATLAWGQHWGSSYPGFQGNLNKTSAFRVRAFRRSII